MTEHAFQALKFSKYWEIDRKKNKQIKKMLKVYPKYELRAVLKEKNKTSVWTFV